MSANLDKSLDDLVGTRRQSRRRSNNRRVAKPSVGGVKKSKAAKAAPKAAHPAPQAAPAASSKIIVSGLVCFFHCPTFLGLTFLLTSSACRCVRGQYQGMLIERPLGLIAIFVFEPHEV